MTSTDRQIPADELRDLYERTGLTMGQFARIFDLSERTVFFALSSSGLQSEHKVKLYRLLQQLTAELELQAIEELTPAVAFNTPRLPALVAQKFLDSSSGRSALQRMLSTWSAHQTLQRSPLSVRDLLGVS